MPPRRSSRTASVSQTPTIETKPIKRKRGQTLEPHNVDLEEDDEDEAANPKRGKRASSVVKPSRPPRRSSRAVENASLETAPVDSLPTIKRKRGQTSIQSHILEEEEIKLEEEEEVDANLKSAAPIDIDDEAPPSPKGRAEEAREDLEETSLFDPPPMPGPSTLLRTIPEEPTGPKSRLVIHKMVLVNFKSYAGRQEIGPFHKVIHSLDNLLQLKLTFSIPILVFLFHCWT